MTAKLGGTDYNTQGRLIFGDRGKREHLGASQDPEPRVEVILCLTGGEETEEEDRTDVEREARVVALRLKELKQKGQTVWDSELNSHRAVEWKDMVILLRATSGKVESYAKEFDRTGVPLQAAGQGLFDSLEVQDLVNLLTLLDNPFQDLPLLAVLRSPIAGLSADELAKVRIAARKVSYWAALARWHETNRGRVDDPTFRKVDTFLSRFKQWRAMARCSSLTQRLERVLEETHYLDWLATQSRAEQRRANVDQLLSLTRSFADLHHQSLYRFLQFLQSEQDAAGDREPPPATAHDAVRLMTIHKSKGLEFPIVVLPDLGKQFNFGDGRGQIILDQELGLCAKVHPPDSGQSYPSLPFWLAKKNQNAEMLSEELRLLYVAMTRAQEMLILSGSCAETKAAAWANRREDYAHPARMRRARRYLDWIGPWLSAHAPSENWLSSTQGRAGSWRWRIVRALPDEEAPENGSRSNQPSTVAPNVVEELTGRLQRSYDHALATSQPGKSSVTALRREAAEELEVEIPFAWGRSRSATDRAGERPDAVEIGVAHHLFLQALDVSKILEANGAQEEVDRLIKDGLLTTEQASLLDLPAITRFWNSEVGREILTHRAAIHRELPFTVRLTRNSDPAIPLLSHIPENEFIVVQGVIDLAVILPREIWLLDFKTDQVDNKEADERTLDYAVQLRLYAIALTQIYRRPVARRWLHFLKPGKTVKVNP